MTLRVAELESLFTANIQPFEQAARKVETEQKRLDGSKANITVDTNSTTAIQDLQRVESSVRGLPDGNMTVEADTSSATRALDDLEDDAGDAGREGGKQAGEGLSDELVAAIISIPIAGAIVGVGVVAGKALMQGISDGLAVEANADRLMAETGLDEASTAVIGRAAGEAYANNWGESVKANLDTARIGLQTGLLDPDATKKDARQIISDLAGVSDLLNEETSRVARSSSQLIKTGIAANADEAFDIIVKGQQEGLNVSEDWLDTIDEYSTQFRALGLTGGQAMGLLRQAVQGGARDTDVAADALKEFAIRGKELEDSEGGYKKLGLDAEEMAAKVAKGGEDATEVLRVVLDELRAVEDPAIRDAAAIELFGTKAEDMQSALYNMDLSSAVNELGAVEGAASSALDALTDNAQNDIDTAQRNLETAATGIKAALADAFGPQIEAGATFVTENREAVVGFLLDASNGAIELGIALVEAFASGTEAVGDFVSGPLVTVASTVRGILDNLNGSPFIDLGDEIDSMDTMIQDMKDFDDASETTADTIRNQLIENGLKPAQERLNEFGDGLLKDAALHDATVRLAGDIDAVGYAASTGKNLLEDYDGEMTRAALAGTELDSQLKAVVSAMEDQAVASALAGEDAATMNERLEESKTALEDQLEAMGLTEDQVDALVEAYGAIPSEISTDINIDTAIAEQRLATLRAKLDAAGISAPIAYGDTAYNRTQPVQENAYGNLNLAGASPLSPIAQMVPPGTLRVVGDRMDVDEAFIPLDGSPRSMAILMETMRRMGVQPMANGGVTGAPTIRQTIRHTTEAPINVSIANWQGRIEELEREARERAATSSNGGYRD